MTDDAFLQAIRESPDDDGPRLVYADWLEENSRLERAEFIRVQCELARLAADDPGRERLELRQRTLLKEFGPQWAGLLRSWVSSWEFHRGLVESITLRHQSFLDHADAMFGAFPIRHVEFQTAMFQLDYPHVVLPSAAPWMPSLANVPHLSRLVSVSFWQNGMGDESVSALAASPHLTRLRSLHLQDNELTDLGTLSLASSPNISELTGLNLATNRISATGARAVAESPHLTKLKSLDLSENPIDGEGVQALAESPGLRHLVTLNLARTAIDCSGARALVESPYLTSLKWLDVRGNVLGNKARRALRVRFGKGKARF